MSTCFHDEGDKTQEFKRRVQGSGRLCRVANVENAICNLEDRTSQ
jgi:hypothetical protein